MTKTTTVCPEIAIQSWLRPALTPVRDNKDYEKFFRTIEDLDKLLVQCHMEELAMEFGMEKLRKGESQSSSNAMADVYERKGSSIAVLQWDGRFWCTISS